MKSIQEIFDNLASSEMLPVIFAGSGITKRYTSNSYDWKRLLIECISQYNADPENKYRSIKLMSNMN
ncbi:hypothetical protein GCM10011409_19270 [Lentibacillus populi]|uniref:Uncharacterized protein n=1 Tax=Lentibacillus populi TaxID=1827502 RepID=A0A9W5TXH1_9BACI|nr:hypothetical protein [Lentibacillus populi]GGB41875.1 hypothetical protein GCM10011409_19270 [Lentibacillus populi]